MRKYIFFFVLFFYAIHNVAQEKPNVLFILVDDLGYGDLSCTGSSLYETPNVDRIALNGTQFTQGYAACQVCSPSRAAIMTGKSPARMQITDWIGAPSGEDWRKLGRGDILLPASYKHVLDTMNFTLAEAFLAQGYSTFFAGKWHLGGTGSSPLDHGFQTNVGGWDKGSPIGGFFDPYENPVLPNRKPGEQLSMRLARETANFIKKQEKPFLAYLSFYAVHAPVQCAPEKWQKYRNKIGSLDGPGFAMEKNLPIRLYQDNPVYAGLVEHMDDAVGEVLQALEESGKLKNTIVVFTSDNGGVASGDNYSTSNSPLRGGKGYQWEGGIREPYFIWVPWKTTPKKVNYPATGMDWYPTLLGLCDLPLQPEHHQDGLNLSPLLEGKSIATRSLYWHYPHYGNQGGTPSSMIRKGDYKLIYNWELGTSALYHLGEDPSERKDLAGFEPKRVQGMEKELMAYLQEVNAQLPAVDSAFNPKEKQQWMQAIQQNRWPSLEKQRFEMMQPDWQPNKDWWGAVVD